MPTIPYCSLDDIWPKVNQKPTKQQSQFPNAPPAPAPIEPQETPIALPTIVAGQHCMARNNSFQEQIQNNQFGFNYNQQPVDPVYNGYYTNNIHQQMPLFNNNMMANNVYNPQRWYTHPNGPSPYENYTGYDSYGSNVEHFGRPQRSQEDVIDYTHAFVRIDATLNYLLYCAIFLIFLKVFEILSVSH